MVEIYLAYKIGVTNFIKTNIGLIVFILRQPRVNKYITIRTINFLSIWTEGDPLSIGSKIKNLREPQKFIHKLLMTIDYKFVFKGVIPKIDEYRKNNL